MTPDDLPAWLAARDLLDAANEVFAKHRVTLEEIMGRDRTPRVSSARQHLWAAMRLEGLAMAEIARLFERNHTTVMAGITTHYKRNPLLEPEPE